MSGQLLKFFLKIYCLEATLRENNLIKLFFIDRPNLLETSFKVILEQFMDLGSPRMLRITFK